MLCVLDIKECLKFALVSFFVLPFIQSIILSNTYPQNLNLDMFYDHIMSNSDSLGNVAYECMRCGTSVTAEELSRLPEIKCICGFRVFRKSRQPIVKQLKAI